MKILKTYENFITDQNRGQLEVQPEATMVNRVEATKYVEKLNLAVKLELAKKLGQDFTYSDETFDLDEFLIGHFMENPADMREGNPQQVLHRGSNRVPLVQPNLGGVLRENKSEYKLKEGEEDLFASEEALVDLIRKEKVFLKGDKIEFENTEEVRSTLDEYLEMDVKK